MRDKSPLFVSCIELIAHSIQLYKGNNQRKFKFAILHLANAVELILNDLMIDKGMSVYKDKHSKTVGLWEAHQKLTDSGMSLPEWPVIELLVDDRNTIQHRFGFPDAQSLFYYLSAVLNFFQIVLKSEYDLEINDVMKQHLSQEELEFVGLSNEPAENETGLDALFAVSPESAVISAYNMVEKRVFTLVYPDLENMNQRELMRSYRHVTDYISKLVDAGHLKSKTKKELRTFRDLRNRAAHATHFINENSDADWEAGLKFAKGLIKSLDKLIDDGFTFDDPPDNSGA